MNKTINLLQKKQLPDKQHSLSVKMKRIAVSLFVLTTGAAILLLILTFTFRMSSLTHKEEKETLATKLSLAKTKAARYILIKDRMSAITHLLAGRYPWDTVLMTIQSQLPDDVVITNMESEDKSLSVSLSSASLLSLNSTIAHITSLLQQKKIFAKVTIDSVAIGEESGLYTLSIKTLLL